MSQSKPTPKHKFKTKLNRDGLQTPPGGFRSTTQNQQIAASEQAGEPAQPTANGANSSPAPNYPQNPELEYKQSQEQLKDQRATRTRQQRNSTVWYKKPFVWILAGLIVIVGLILAVFLFINRPTPSASTPASPTSSSVSKKAKLTTKPKLKTKQAPKKLQPDQKVQNEPNKKNDAAKRHWNNPGSYDNMKYDNDDFTIQLNNSSDGVKLIPDSDQKPALYIEYTFTNKSKQPLKPQDAVGKDIQLKQNDQVLTGIGPAGDNQDAQNKINAAQKTVDPGQKADVAMMFVVANTKDQIIMSFKNLETDQFITTTQPFKL